MRNTTILLLMILVLMGMNLLNRDSNAKYEVLLDDYQALQEAYDELYDEYEVMKDGYRDLQQEHSKKTEQIEYLEYRIMSDDEISEELKQEIKENVPEEGKR